MNFCTDDSLCHQPTVHYQALASQVLSGYEESFRQSMAEIVEPVVRSGVERRVQQAYHLARLSSKRLLDEWDRRGSSIQIAAQAVVDAERDCGAAGDEWSSLAPKFLVQAERATMQALALQVIREESVEEVTQDRDQPVLDVKEKGRAREEPQRDFESLVHDVYWAGTHFLWAHLRPGDVVFKDDEKGTSTQGAIARSCSEAKRMVRRLRDEGCCSSRRELIDDYLLPTAIRLVCGRFYHTGLIHSTEEQEKETAVRFSHLVRKHMDEEVALEDEFACRFFRFDMERLLTLRGRELIARRTGVVDTDICIVAQALFQAICDRLHEMHRDQLGQMQLSLTRAAWAYLSRNSSIEASSVASPLVPQKAFCSEFVTALLKRAFEVFASLISEGDGAEPVLVSPLASYDPKLVTPSSLFEIVRPYVVEINP